MQRVVGRNGCACKPFYFTPSFDNSLVGDGTENPRPSHRSADGCRVYNPPRVSHHPWGCGGGCCGRMLSPAGVLLCALMWHPAGARNVSLLVAVGAGGAPALNTAPPLVRRPRIYPV